ncbi:MAG TPA: NUDIX hydrolase [Candidatus Hydrogenedentes bacterium]|nr:NUDIX hydrolase [Candidatus Hydrogenedentota bacterium]HOT50659.1 NUDIX hydrolase [Candidatus Hydrogenedentota bacterium]HOV72952.1 NUDIX hydrolase [Candidatus Hydrogenedentota bacterium]HPC15798.1 NUDIX hydrolase [Candidatus Hydrogenedentota bacterium]HRT19794.1 NUDIX hydrolase [Candidatus Hydrogenedentota bacterium]
MPGRRRGQKRRPQIRVAAVIIRKGEILLARHERNGKRYWVLPGGGVEYGESLEEALAREILEETHFKIRVGRLLFLFDSIRYDGRRHVVNICFRARITGGRLKVGREGRLVDVRFVPLKRLSRIRVCPDLSREILRQLRKASPAYLGCASGNDNILPRTPD